MGKIILHLPSDALLIEAKAYSVPTSSGWDRETKETGIGLLVFFEKRAANATRSLPIDQRCNRWKSCGWADLFQKLKLQLNLNVAPNGGKLKNSTTICQSLCSANHRYKTFTLAVAAAAATAVVSSSSLNCSFSVSLPFNRASSAHETKSILHP